MSFKPQSEDYFNLTGVGFYNGSASPQATAHITTTVPSYVTYYKNSLIQLGYTFMYYDGVAYPNPVPNGVPYIGATAINGLSMVVDEVEITNNSTTSIVIDLIKASPANIKVNGVNIIPPVTLDRYVIASGDSVSLNKDDIDIIFKNYVAQTQTTPYYMTGDGLAVAFPDSVKVTTTGTTTTTTTYTTEYGIYNVSVSGVAHFEP